MLKNLCHLCGQLICEHPHRHTSSFNNQHHNYHEHNHHKPISLGENVGDPVKITYTDTHSDILDDDGNPLSIQNRDLPREVKPMTPETNTNLKDWVKCNLCTSNIHVDYLTGHLKTHAYMAEKPTPKSVSSATQASSTAIVRVSDHTTSIGSGGNGHTSSSATSSNETSWSSLIAKSNAKDKPTLQSLETYKFRELKHVCAFGSSSKSNRYSDFTVVFWTDEVSSVQNTSYYGTGYSSYVSKDWERLSIHSVYDSLEEYYVVSCKLSRRGHNSSWDNDDCIPDRICYQNELMTEIKRAMLFFRVNPKSAYRLFRKLFDQNVKITYDPNDGKVLFAQTESYGELSDRLKNSSSSTTTTYGQQSMERFHGYENYGGWDG
jgi:hypothetical protein